MEKNDKSFLIEFGHRLRLLRVDKRLSQDKLADLSGLERSYISNIENGKQNPSIIVINQFINALGYDLDFKKK